MVIARLERHVQRRVARTLTGGRQRDHLGVTTARLRDAFTDDLSVGHDDGANRRLRVRTVAGGARELDGARERQPSACTRLRYACGGSPAAKIDDAATSSVAPLA